MHERTRAELHSGWAFAVAGIETNTRKLFQVATEAGKACVIVINKLDAENVEMPELLKNIKETFGTKCRCANLPGANDAHPIKTQYTAHDRSIIFCDKAGRSKKGSQ